MSEITKQRVLNHVNDAKRTSVTYCAKMLGISASTSKRHLRNLVLEGDILAKQHGYRKNVTAVHYYSLDTEDD